MPKLKNNTPTLVKEYLDSKDKLTTQTKKTYEGIGNNIPFNVLTTQNTIIRKLKELLSNPNTLQIYLNVIILVRRHNDEPTEKLIKFRNSLRDDIIKLRKERLGELKGTLPSKADLLDKLKELKGVQYIINYLFINYGLRNKDVNLKVISDEPPKDDENYLVRNKKTATLYIRDYKTDGKYGDKVIKFKDKRFLDELKNLNIDDDKYLLSKRNGEKMKLSTFNEKIKGESIMNLGETKIFKILIGDLIDKKDYDEIEKLVQSRGTSLNTILKSYNIHNS